MGLLENYDLVIIGAGMGGSALAYALRHTSHSILILERGEYIRQEDENWDIDAVITQRRYDPDDTWVDADGQEFTPRVYYNVGGSSKFFGGSSFRYREVDLTGRVYPEGETVPWPVSYEDLSPYYDEAEQAMKVRGLAGADPTEPPRGAYPFPPIESEPPIAQLAEGFRERGLTPFPLPIAVYQGTNGHCRKGSPCDGFPCKIRAKGDGENAFFRPALKDKKDITVITSARVTRLHHDTAGDRISHIEVMVDGKVQTVSARLFVLAAGAANTAALLLGSASDRYPHGIANGSGQVGKNFMAHNNTVLMAFSLFRKNPTRFQKTITLNDFYHGDCPQGPGAGNIQMRGKVQAANNARHANPLVRLFAGFIAARSFDFWLMSEDLPSAENRVEVVPAAGGGTRIRLSRRLNNLSVHRDLVRSFRKILRSMGFSFIIERTPSPSVIQHQVGTARAGHDPATSVVNSSCRAHELENLYIVDGSIFPSSAAVNPALTIAANALRVGSILAEELDRAAGKSGN